MGLGRGLRFNAFDSLAGYALGSAEPSVQLALERIIRPGMTVFDIGANVGFFTVIAARLVGDGGTVVAFEPLPENVAAIHHNVELNGFGSRVRVEQAAVGDSDGVASFVVREMGGWGHVGAGGSLAVQTVMLDARISAGQVPVPDLIKLDIEGGEVAALAGLRSTLADHRPVILVELHETHDPVRAVLESARYEVEVLIEAQAESDLGNAHLLAYPSGTRAPA
jgi:FkbM family methyltransferase